MIRRFCLYAIFRNLRFFDAFFVLFLLLELKLSYTLIGVVLAYEKILLGLCEVPLATVGRFFVCVSLFRFFVLMCCVIVLWGVMLVMFVYCVLCLLCFFLYAPINSLAKATVANTTHQCLQLLYLYIWPNIIQILKY